MKKLTLFAIAALITTIAGAQVQFGLKAGLNLANLSVSPSEDGSSFKMKPNLNAGGFAYVPLFGHFGLQPEIMYSAQGTKISAEGTSINYNLNYVNVPVLFKYKDASGFFAELGPQIGILVAGKAKSGSQSEDIKSSFKSTDISGALGIGYLSSLNLGIDARYSLGLTNIIKDANGSSAKNGVIQVGVFYMFGGSKK
jgi:hypothetical protein